MNDITLQKTEVSLTRYAIYQSAWASSGGCTFCELNIDRRAS